jgi:hypothetical protein
MNQLSRSDSFVFVFVLRCYVTLQLNLQEKIGPLIFFIETREIGHM